jgi:hypothetical protein
VVRIHWGAPKLNKLGAPVSFRERALSKDLQEVFFHVEPNVTNDTIVRWMFSFVSHRRSISLDLARLANAWAFPILSWRQYDLGFVQVLIPPIMNSRIAAAMETNPYAPPLADLSGPGKALEVETVRKAHLNAEGNLQSIGGIYVLGAALLLAALVNIVLKWDAANPPSGFLIAVLFVGALVHGTVGLALFQLKAGARWPSTAGPGGISDWHRDWFLYPVSGAQSVGPIHPLARVHGHPRGDTTPGCQNERIPAAAARRAVGFPIVHFPVSSAFLKVLPRGCAPIGKLCCCGLRKYERGEKRHTRQYSC